MRRAFRFAGVDEKFQSEQFSREWAKSTAKESGSNDPSDPNAGAVV